MTAVGLKMVEMEEVELNSGRLAILETTYSIRRMRGIGHRSEEDEAVERFRRELLRSANSRQLP
jgi:hypothetical protein